MTGKRTRGNPVPLSDLAAPLLDPVLRRRTGMSLALVQSWGEIVGPRLSAHSRPEKIAWPRRAHEDDPFEPATLIVASEGISALHIQHETGEIVARVNAFLGFAAIGRIKLVQKPLETGPKRDRPPAPRPVSAETQARLGHAVSGIEDEDLRASLEKLGRSVYGSRK